MAIEPLYNYDSFGKTSGKVSFTLADGSIYTTDSRGCMILPTQPRLAGRSYYTGGLLTGPVRFQSMVSLGASNALKLAINRHKKIAVLRNAIAGVVVVSGDGEARCGGQVDREIGH